MKCSVAALLCAIGLAGCSHTAPETTACRAIHGTPMLQVTLMFGLTRPNGAPITEAQWHDFVSETVTPLFPDGLTILPGSGQWRDRQSAIVTHEPSRLILIATPDRPDLAQGLTAIRNAYRRQFQQQSVGITAAPGCAAF